MTFPFESPGKLEERIAANMADESDDLSFGVGRNAPSFASVSISTDENSMSRNGLEDSSFADQSRTDQRSGWTNPRHSQASNLTSGSNASRTAVLAALDTNIPAHSSSRRIEALSTPRASKPDQERMKAYLINSVKSINPLREAQLRHLTPRRRRIGDISLSRTPLSGPSRLRLGDEVSEENPTESFVSDASSTRDLTLPAKFATRANTSFPGIGLNEGAAPNNARVDPARLQGYLHKINVQLEAENVSLKEEKEILKRQFDRALVDLERVRMQIESRGETSTRQTAQVSQGTMTSNDEVESLRRENEELRIGQEELNEMLDEREAKLEMMERKLQEQREEEGHGKEGDDRFRDLEEELAEEREASDQQRIRFEGKMKEAMDEADKVQRTAELKLMQERDEALAELEEVKLSARGSMYQSAGAGEDFAEYEEREQRAQSALLQAKEIQEELEQRLDEDVIAFDELEADYNQIKEELLVCKEELDTAKDQIMDIQIVVEEKESENIRLNMQLRQARESTELPRLRERVVLLEAQLEGAKQESVRQQSTPIHKNVAHLRNLPTVDTPRSPAELSNASWLNHESTLGDKSVMRNLHELRARVDDAHAQTDEKLAELGTGRLAQMMVELQDQLAGKEKEITLFQDREKRWKMQVEKIRCSHCKTKLGNKIDLDQSVISISRGSVSMMTDHTEGEGLSILAKSTRSAIQKEQIVAEIAEQLQELKARWAVDRAKLDGDREAMDVEKQQWLHERKQLETENDKLKREKAMRGREAKENVKRMQDGTLNDLSRARRIIGEFERELREDCARFQEAMQSSKGLDQDSNEVERELIRTKQKLGEVERELKAKVELFERLQNEYFEKSHLDGNLPLHVQLLELDVQKFSLEVESLRDQRNLILEERQTLHLRHRANQEGYLNMYEELKSAKEAIDAHQIQLDEQIETIEKLHETLTVQNKDLEELYDDRDRLKGQRTEILKDVASLEMDLRRVREESRRFGNDLQAIRAGQAGQEETGKVERKERKQKEEMEKIKEAYRIKESTLTNRHHAECQGLLLQIRYEKAKYMREVDLRSDMIQQKHYILNVLGGLQLVDATTKAFLDSNVRGRLSDNVNKPTEKNKSKGNNNSSSKDRSHNRFRVVAWTVVAICRTQIMAEHWRKTVEVKESLRNAHKAAKLLRVK